MCPQNVWCYQDADESIKEEKRGKGTEHLSKPLLSIGHSAKCLTSLHLFLLSVLLNKMV